MYRILIVDDEEIIRQGLTQIIDWTEIGFEVAGTARSGSSAVEFIHNESVDVVILDIKMPKMSGLEVSRYLYEHFPAIKIVILSGYAEFEYAQKTINYNVFSYLLKPSRKEVIQELFLKLKSIMDNERMESNLQSKGEYLEIKNLISSLLVQSGLQEGQSLTYAQNNWLETHRKKEALPTIVWEKGKNQAYLNETG
jgi:YesN/AraC family two-component response regulator